jgi:hypothetical protein
MLNPQFSDRQVTPITSTSTDEPSNPTDDLSMFIVEDENLVYEEQEIVQNNLQAPSEFDIYQELKQIEEIIYESPRVPLTGLTIVDEEQLLNQINHIRLHLPDAFSKAADLVQRQQQIVQQAQAYAEQVVSSAQAEAAKILDQTEIIQQAELEATAIQQQNEALCQQSQQETQTQLEELRQATQKECQAMQQEADQYAKAVLDNLEHQLQQALSVVRNGSQQLET